MEGAVKEARVVTPDDRIRLPAHERQMGTQGQYRHRSGWPYVVAALREAQGCGDLLLDDYVERTFGSRSRRGARRLRSLVKRMLPMAAAPAVVWEEPWVGVFHHPPSLPTWFDPSAHPRAVFAEPGFRKSRRHLRGAIALSEYLAGWLRKELSVPAVALKHPTEFPDTKFSWEAFERNGARKLVQVGWYLRNYRAIYQVRAPEWLEKVHLAQAGTAIEQARQRTDRHSPYRRRPDVGHVKVMARLEDEAYDRLITENVLFLELLDASANNAVVEAIVRETPLVVNRHPAVVEYLGAGYPLFYDDIRDVHDLLSPPRIKEAHDYLRSIDKSDLRVEHFVEEVRRFMAALA